MNILTADINILKGIGPSNQKLLNKIKCYTIRDLLLHLPHNYEIRQYQPLTLQEKSKVIITAKILAHNIINKKIHIIKTSYMNEFIDIVFFTNPTYLYSFIKIGEFIGVVGEITRQSNKYKVTHPQMVALPYIDTIPRIMPIYSLTKGLHNILLYKMIRQAIDLIAHNHFNIKDILTEIHLLGDDKNIFQLIILEFITYHIKMRALKNRREKHKNTPIVTDNIAVSKFVKDLPFILTEGQKAAIVQIRSDLQSDNQMSRLLQGDVGCGKTIVALISALEVIYDKKQVAFMAPTEILARQHYANIVNLCDKINVRIACLTSSTAKKEKELIYKQMQQGELDLIIGTHSLLNEELNFHDLALIIIDEQHRFGVKQRQKLLMKSENPNLLYMSATPIPRTMALALYGDMEITEIIDKPKDRKSIITVIKSIEDDVNVIKAFSNIIKKGEKIYWVCPQITDDEDTEIANVEARYKDISRHYPGKVLLLHGNMKSKEKDVAMHEFITGDKYILVATTVIEVGVDVKDASVIVIDQAERFGLAQLHQLRGRVGRGELQSYCILLHAEHLSANSKKRLMVMRETEDGFKIAQEDMKLRGAGDVFGTTQSGLPQFKVGNLNEHYDVFLEAYHIEKALSKEKRNSYNMITEFFE